MKIFVRVKPRSREALVKRVNGTHFDVWVKEPAKRGEANEAVLEALAGSLDVAKSRFKIISGKSSKQKIIEVL